MTKARLRSHAFLYENLVRGLGKISGASIEERLAGVELVAAMASSAHPGRFADGALENIALDAGMALRGKRSAAVAVRSPGRGQSTTVHVASTVLPTGGHSRVLTSWMEADYQTSQTLVLTRQTRTIPDFLKARWAAANVDLVVLDHTRGILERAAILRSIGEQADRIILHQHPDDAVPVVAFAESSTIPVAMFNHAHFWYSMGATVSDITINTLPYFESLSKRARFARRTAVLTPSAVGAPREAMAVDKGVAKELLGLRASDPVAISVGAQAYFEPSEAYDFFRTLRKLLRQVPNLRVLLVGLDRDCPFLPADLRENPALHAVGAVEDVIPYYEAADIVLESFPMPSLGAFIEAVRLGEAFPVPVYGVGENIRRVDLPVLSDHVKRATSEEAYIEQVAAAVRELDASRHTAQRIKHELNAQYSEFPERLALVYQQMEHYAHSPSSVPEMEMQSHDDNVLMAAVTKSSLIELIDCFVTGRPRDVLLMKAMLRRHIPVKRIAFGLFKRMARVSR